MNAAERMSITAAMSMMGLEHHTDKGPRKEGLRAAVRFLWTLTQSDADMISLYRRMHRSGTVAPKIVIVSHMMDLAPVYDQVPDGAALIGFEREQIERMQHFRRRFGPDFHYFVAYNPYRDHWQGGKPGDALRLVQDAVRRRGATGVKVYPPSGYRVAGNAVRTRPWTLLTRKPGEQWDARYAALGRSPAVISAGLDQRLESLLEWCEREDVPVFTHCGHGEFEARKGYGEYHSHPRWWQQYLERHSTPGSPCRLRLCLGHAGGDDFWFGRGKHADWGRTVFHLCTSYPNVYCEITSDAMLLDLDRTAIFVDHLARCFAESDGAPYPLAAKLVFGTDWYLPDPAAPDEILRAAQRAFLHPSLRRHFADYFTRNARKFLKSGRG
jgi:predicted TIM-barrel fold metal-dependent hydrolase